MVNRIRLAILTMVLGSGASEAHELKVLVSEWMVPNAPGQVTVYLSWGHRLPVDGLIPATTLERYEMLTPDGKTVQLKSAGQSLQANAVVLEQPGVYRAIAVRKPSVLTYVLDDDGNKQMRLGSKTEHKEAKIDSAFRSVQCSTALVVVGENVTDAVKPAGLPIEIVPLDSPSDWHAGKAVRVRVLLDGKPAKDVALEAHQLSFKADAEWIPVGTTGANGELTLPEADANVWILKAQAEKPATASDRKQFDVEKYTAILSVEIKE